MVRTEAELDQSARIGSELGLPTLVGLEFEHGSLGVGVPFSGWFAAKVVLADEGLLDG